MSTATKLPPSDTGICGTPAGGKRHDRRGEDTCQPCRKAKNTYDRDYRAANAVRLRLRPSDVARAKPLPLGLGRFVGEWVPHAFRQLHPSRGSTQCAECFGWLDDPRHL